MSLTWQLVSRSLTIVSTHAAGSGVTSLATFNLHARSSSTRVGRARVGFIHGVDSSNNVEIVTKMLCCKGWTGFANELLLFTRGRPPLDRFPVHMIQLRLASTVKQMSCEVRTAPCSRRQARRVFHTRWSWVVGCGLWAEARVAFTCTRRILYRKHSVGRLEAAR